jgi:hypothetical protein
MKFVAMVGFLVLVASAPAVAYEPGALRLSDSQNNKIEGADVRLTADGRIVGQIDSLHAASASDMIVRESENCEFRKTSPTEIRLGQRCEFVSGVFTYIFQIKSGARHQMVLGFTASRQGSSNVFLASSPLVVLAK